MWARLARSWRAEDGTGDGASRHGNEQGTSHRKGKQLWSTRRQLAAVGTAGLNRCGRGYRYGTTVLPHHGTQMPCAACTVRPLPIRPCSLTAMKLPMARVGVAGTMMVGLCRRTSKHRLPTCAIHACAPAHRHEVVDDVLVVPVGHLPVVGVHVYGHVVDCAGQGMWAMSLLCGRHSGPAHRWQQAPRGAQACAQPPTEPTMVLSAMRAGSANHYWHWQSFSPVEESTHCRRI